MCSLNLTCVGQWVSPKRGLPQVTVAPVRGPHEVPGHRSTGQAAAVFRISCISLYLKSIYELSYIIIQSHLDKKAAFKVACKWTMFSEAIV